MFDIPHISFDEYFGSNELSKSVFKAKYCLPGDESVTDVFDRVANGLAQYEKEPSTWRRRWVNEMLEGWYRPGGSILAGVVNTAKVSLANCTTIALEDDTIDAISNTNKNMMKCAARRQGLGVDVSKIRPRGSRVNNAANESNGVVPWMEYLNNISNFVGQKGRMPAMLLSLKIEHPDIEEFIGCKSDQQKITNANISVQVSDAFMKAVENDEDWTMSFTTPYETIEKKKKARDIMRLISEKACKTAEPGVQFIDNARKGTMTHQVYKSTGDERFKVISSNACSEKFLPNASTCVLASLNMAKFSVKKDEYINQLQTIVPSLVRLMDNAVEYEIQNDLAAIPEQKWIIGQLREIGLGITNVHAWFLKQNIAYDSDDAVNALEDFFSNYMGIAYKASVELAKEKGPAEVYKLYNNIDLSGSIAYSNIRDKFFNGKELEPLRNLAIGSIAPTGSLSLTFSEPTLSSGIEPAIGAYYWRKTRALSQDGRAWRYYFCLPEAVKKFIISHNNFNNLGDAEREAIINCPESKEDPDGHFGLNIKYIIDPILSKVNFKPAHEIDPFQKIKMMAKIYRWLDSACSVTYNLPKETTPDTIMNIYIEAWRQGVRAVSVYVDGSREGILVFEPPKEEEKKDNVFCEERPEHITFTCAPKREKKLPCEIHRCKVRGQDWLVLVGILNEYPYEIFAGEYDKDNMYVPASVEKGFIIKKKSGEYSLVISVKGAEVEYKNIAHTFMNETYRSMTRMISLALRHGVRPVYIIDQMKKADEGITDFSSVITRILNKYIRQLDYSYLSKSTGFKCEFCGGTEAVFTGGCKTCANCGKGSKCD